jgi:16S rRNA processing protein RimM
MLLAGHLAKVQGLKGEFLLHALSDEPEALKDTEGLVLAPPHLDLQGSDELPAGARPITLRVFRWQQQRPCVAFEGIPDRTAAEPFKGWALWIPETARTLPAGESYRHDWVGCDVAVAGRVVGEVLRLEPTPMGYDMVVIRDRRPGRTGTREVPYIKAWWTVDLPARRLELDGPPGILDLDGLAD